VKALLDEQLSPQIAALLRRASLDVAAVTDRPDLAGRSDDRVRGKKNVWRAFMLLNPGNSVFYWLCGRR